MKAFRPVSVRALFLILFSTLLLAAFAVASVASLSPDPPSTIVEGGAASNAASDTSSSPDPPSALIEANGEAASQPAKNLDFGGFHLGGAGGDDGHSDDKSGEGDGYLKSTLKKYDDEGYDVKGTCAKMYPKRPDCDCRFVQDGELMSNSARESWGSEEDQCLFGTPGWKFDVCLKTSDDIEGTRGKVTLYSPSSCTNTQHKIVCMIEKFRFAPTYERFPDDPSIGFRASGRVFYDGNDGKGVQTHGCEVEFGRLAGEDELDFYIRPGPFEDLQQSWIYPGAPFTQSYRRFYSSANDGPFLTSGSGDVVKDMKECGLPVTG